MIDVELVMRKLGLIANDLKPITRLSEMSLADFIADPHAEVLAERYLERIVGRMIDINYHMVTESGEAPPRDYYDSFLKMGSIGILPVEFTRQLASCAGLRNRIVHEYDDIDPARIHAALKSTAQDIPVYLSGVEKHLPRED